MKPFAIRKCDDCGNWHLWHLAQIAVFVIPMKILTTETFEDMLIAINETDLSDLYA